MKQKAMRTVHSIPAPRPSWTMSPADVGQELETEILGFRLVYDNAPRFKRGSSWNYPLWHDPAPYTNTARPGLDLPGLGFRLCVDWREG